MMFVWFIIILLQILQRSTSYNTNDVLIEVTSINWNYSQTNIKTNVAIIGASGYLGSRLLEYLLSNKAINVIGYDQHLKHLSNHYLEHHYIRYMKSLMIPDHDLIAFDYIIYLDGLLSNESYITESTDDIVQLSHRMTKKQVLIFAYTTSMVEVTGSVVSNKSEQVNMETLDEYSQSFYQREVMLSNFVHDLQDDRSMIALRLGTVVGISPNQYTDDNSLNTLVRNAFLDGYLTVSNAHIYRSFLWIEDFTRAIQHIISSTIEVEPGLHIYNMTSIHGTIAKFANHIAWRTGARVVYNNNEDVHIEEGIVLNTNKFSNHWNFTFTDDPDIIIQDLITNVPKLIMEGNELPLDEHSVQCAVCGSKHMVTILDLGAQPLANDFKDTSEEALACEVYPLKQVRCHTCNHTQLSYIVPRDILFKHYLYQSGTSNTGNLHFKWIAKKVISESIREDLEHMHINSNNTGKESLSTRVVLDIASNDGSQLDEFLPFGWKTYGVDPAENLVQIAREKGHTIYSGFWGSDDDHSQIIKNQLKIIEIDAIIAQNVLAHTDAPLAFLLATADIMTLHTKLYIQTSQCSMFETGQFDTIYHEHVSFFTAHSFQKLSELAGLHIVNFETVPIHGTSCLVTMMKKNNISMNSFNYDSYHDRINSESNNTSNKHIINSSSTTSVSLQASLTQELYSGVTSDWYYIRYRKRIHRLVAWLHNQITMHALLDAYDIIGFGAAAKGMVLLNYLLSIQQSRNESYRIQFIIDEAPLKLNKYCPGTNIPVTNLQGLSNLSISSDKPLLIIIFSWNFFDEIMLKLKDYLLEMIRMHHKAIHVLVPFPKQILYEITIDYEYQIIAENDYYMMAYPNIFPPDRRKVIMINHFYNEAFLMPHFIRSHAHHFDEVILIDYNSNDSSIEIIEREAPPSWQVFSTRNPYFSAAAVDTEVMEYEQRYPHDWKIALTSTEFIVHANLRGQLHALDNLQQEEHLIYHFPDFSMIGDDSIPFNTNQSLLYQRSQFVYNLLKSDSPFQNHYSRVIHRYPDLKYDRGRHNTFQGHGKQIPDGLLLKYAYTPWPDIKNRKIQLQSKFSQTDIYNAVNYNMGTHHLTNQNYLEMQRIEEIYGVQGSWIYEHGNVTYQQYASKVIDDFNMNTNVLHNNNNIIINSKYIKSYKNIWRNALRIHEKAFTKVVSSIYKEPFSQSSTTLIGYPRFQNAVHVPIAIYSSNTINVFRYTFILHENLLTFDKHIYCAILDPKLAVDSPYFFDVCTITDLSNTKHEQELSMQDLLYSTNMCGDAVWCQESSQIMHRILGWQYPIPINTCDHKKFLLIDINDLDEQLNIYQLMLFIAKSLKLAICTNRILYIIPIDDRSNKNKNDSCTMLSCFIEDITSCHLTEIEINQAFPIYNNEVLSQAYDRKVINILNASIFDLSQCLYPLSNTIFEQISNKAIFENIEYAMLAPFIRHVFRLKPYVIDDIQQGLRSYPFSVIKPPFAFIQLQSYQKDELDLIITYNFEKQLNMLSWKRPDIKNILLFFGDLPTTIIDISKYTSFHIFPYSRNNYTTTTTTTNNNNNNNNDKSIYSKVIKDLMFLIFSIEADFFIGSLHSALGTILYPLERTRGDGGLEFYSNTGLPFEKSPLYIHTNS